MTPLPTTTSTRPTRSTGDNHPVRVRLGATLAAGVLAASGVAASQVLPMARAQAPVVPTQAQGVLPQPTGTALATASDLRAIPRAGQGVGIARDRVGAWGAGTSLCQRPTSLGERTLLVRRYQAVGTTEAVLGFDTVAQATAARGTLLTWYRDCGAATATARQDGAYGRALPVTLPASTTAGGPVRANLAYASRGERDSEVAQFEDAVVVQVGNRVAWLTVSVSGQDNECSEVPGDVVGQCGAYASAQAVASRLTR